jgi:hypothetical protein
MKKILLCLLVTGSANAITMVSLVTAPIRTVLNNVQMQLENAQTLASITANTKAITAGKNLAHAQYEAQISITDLQIAQRDISEINNILSQAEGSNGASISMNHVLKVIKNFQELFLITQHFKFVGMTLT